MIKEGEYYYTIKGKWYAIYRKEEYRNGISSGTFIEGNLDREEARKKVYQLNGWDYKEPIKK